MPYFPKGGGPKTIPYDSPSGEITVSKWIPPFMEVPDGGYGFLGVVAHDTSGNSIQCHMCGEWFSQLGRHLTSVHDISPEAYRIKFGLLKSTSLRCERLNEISRKTYAKNQKEGKMTGGDNFGRSQFKKGKANKWAANGKGRKAGIELKNKYGVCDLQLATKITTLAEEMGKTPSLVDLAERYGPGINYHIRNRGGYIKYCKELGLKPLTSAHNPYYSREVFIQKGVDAILDGEEPKLSLIYTKNEQRYIYKYFSGWNEAKQEIFKTLDAMPI